MCRHRFRMFIASAATAALLGGSTLTRAAVLYNENFNPPGKTFPANNADVERATVVDDGTGNGILSINDTDDSGKGDFAAVQDFNSDAMTFSFDVVAPVTEPNAPTNLNDLIFRAGTRTDAGMLSSSQDILELILYRDGNRGGYQNTGNESVFVVANNSATNSLDFASPVDGSTVTLTTQQYAAYIRDNSNGTFVQAKAPTPYDMAGSIVSFAIGNSSNSYEGTAAIDNVGVVDQVSFETVVPEPVSLSLLGGIGALLLGRRRRRPAAPIA